jgi:hypothetical protein
MTWQRSDLRLAALTYAERGWPVLPLVPHKKNPLTTNGLLDSSVDPAKINDWWRRWPNANIGLRTGVTFCVLDIDGDEGRASLVAAAGPEWNHSGPVSRTGRGEHWLYLPSNTQNRAGLLPKLDWRGTNGYIVAPPSHHPDGHDYEWVQSPDDHALSDTPDWLTPLLLTYREKQAYTDQIRIIQVNEYDRMNPVKAKILDTTKLAALKTDIVAIAVEMGYAVAPRGPRWVMTCIFHDGDNEASLTLYPHDNSFYCFGCGAWGDAINLRDKRAGGTRAK